MIDGRGAIPVDVGQVYGFHVSNEVLRDYLLIGPPEVDGLGVLVLKAHLVQHLAHDLGIDALEGYLIVLALEVAELKAICEV